MLHNRGFQENSAVAFQRSGMALDVAHDPPKIDSFQETTSSLKYF